MDDNTEKKNKTYQLTVSPGQREKIRLDKYISNQLGKTSRSKIKEAIDNGSVLVNQKREKPSYEVEAGDVIDITLPKPPPPKAEPENVPLNIVYEDDDLIVLNKPSGMVVHPGVGNWHGTLVNGLLYYTENLAASDENKIRPGLVHRLDKDTSGLLVAAKSDKALSDLGKQFKEKTVERTYWALIWGHPKQKKGRIRGYIGRDPRDRKKFAVVPKNKGKYAVTYYTVKEYFDHLTLLQVQLDTGRTHQIRVHFSHFERPVFGDPVYGGDAVRYGPNTGGRQEMYDRLFNQLDGQCLHAKTLGFTHPRTGKFMQFDSRLPGDFQEVLDTLRIKAKD